LRGPVPGPFALARVLVLALPRLTPVPARGTTVRMSTADRIRIRVVVRGRVQGVWYRGFAREQALAAGLVGWVRNNPDGSVEGVAEGSRAAVDRWLDALRQGPPMAFVTDVDRRDEPGTPPLEGFRVVR